jgi:hypothetical protein
MAICKECSSHIDSGYCGTCLIKEISKALVATTDRPNPKGPVVSQHSYGRGWIAGRKILRKRIREAISKAKSGQRII